MSTDKKSDTLVEVAFQIAFLDNEKILNIKLTAYTTTSKIMLQPIGGKNHSNEVMDMKSIPGFFAEKIIIPWCNEQSEDGKFTEEMRKDIGSSLKEAAKKADTRKTKQENNVSETKKDAKCLTKSFSYTGINPLNTSAVGKMLDL